MSCFNHRHWFSFFLLVLAGIFMGRGALAQDAVRVGGTGTGTVLIQRLIDSYSKSHPGIQVTAVMPPIGSNGSLRALAGGSIQIAVVSTPAKPEDAGVQKYLPWVRTPLVFTGRNVVAGTQLTTARIADLYAGTSTQWPDGSTVRVVMRSEREADTKILRAFSPAIDGAITLAQRRVGIPLAENDIENLQLLERTPGSFGVIALGQLLLSDSMLKPIVLDGVVPSLENLTLGTYRLEKPLYLVTGATPSTATLEFLKYLQSPETIELMRRYGFAPLKR